MCDKNRNANSSGVRFDWFPRADDGKMRAANKPYSLKRKIVGIIINLEHLVVLYAGPISASLDMSFSLGLCFLRLFSLRPHIHEYVFIENI